VSGRLAWSDYVYLEIIRLHPPDYDINQFDSSPTGRKVIERLPVLVQMRNQLASQRLQENIGELRREIETQSTQ